MVDSINDMRKNKQVREYRETLKRLVESLDGCPDLPLRVVYAKDNAVKALKENG